MFYTQSGTPFPQASAASTAGRAALLISRAGLSVWRYLEDVGQRRARRAMLMMAASSTSDRELALQMREAAAFDSTSRAAADRHEAPIAKGEQP